MEHKEIIDACRTSHANIFDDDEKSKEMFEFMVDNQVLGTIQGVFTGALTSFAGNLMEQGMPPAEAMTTASAMGLAMLVRVAFEAGLSFASIAEQREAALAEFAALLDPSIFDLTGDTFTEDES